MPEIQNAPFGGLDLLSSSVLLLDEKLCILYMNSAAENLLAVSGKNARGVPLEKIAECPGTLLEALESNNVPVAAACRAGVCGCCKTKVISGEYTVTSTMTLTEAEIAEGYVLACSCHPQGDLVLA